MTKDSVKQKCIQMYKPNITWLSFKEYRKQILFFQNLELIILGDVFRTAQLKNNFPSYRPKTSIFTDRFQI